MSVVIGGGVGHITDFVRMPDEFSAAGHDALLCDGPTKMHVNVLSRHGGYIGCFHFSLCAVQRRYLNGFSSQIIFSNNQDGTHGYKIRSTRARQRRQHLRGRRTTILQPQAAQHQKDVCLHLNSLHPRSIPMSKRSLPPQLPDHPIQSIQLHLRIQSVHPIPKPLYLERETR
jgi:hypothetical protein